MDSTPPQPQVTSRPGDPPTDFRARVPSRAYYRLRNQDFLQRHPGLAPPPYYLGYGDRYEEVFFEKVRPRLSVAGQGFVDRVFVLLQSAIEDQRAASPSAFDTLEQNGAAFQHFAYHTHPRCYLAAGFGKLDFADVLIISSTATWKDFFTADALAQTEEVFAGIFREHLAEFAHWAEAELAAVRRLFDRP